MSPQDHSESNLLTVAGIVLDVDAREVTAHGKVHHLTPMECRLLEVLMANAGRVLDYEYIMEEVWDMPHIGDLGTLQVHISWLRTKIEKDRSNPVRIQTIRKVGYRFIGMEELE